MHIWMWCISSWRHQDKKCVLLGYGTNQKGQHLYDVKHKKIVHNGDVVFDDTSLPGIEKEKAIKYVELERIEEPIVECTTTNGETKEITINDQQSEEPLPTNPNFSEAVPGLANHHALKRFFKSMGCTTPNL